MAVRQWLACAPRNSQRDVHLPPASEVEGVEGHLGGRLPDGLGCQQAHRLSWVTQRSLPLVEQQLAEAASTHTDTDTHITKRKEKSISVWI